MFVLSAEFTKQFLIQKLIRIYNETEFHIHEHVLAAIIALIDNNPEAIKQAKHMNLDFKNIISRRLSLIENEPGSLVSIGFWQFFFGFFFHLPSILIKISRKKENMLHIC